MGFFDFITDLPRYRDRPYAVPRLNQRHAFLIAPFAEQISGARVLDLGAHDGRWSYAFAGCGAREVIGIEARAELIADFADFPDAALRDRVQLRAADMFDALQQAVDAGERFDVIAVFGVFYHIMDHFRLLSLIRQLQPGLVIMDSEFNMRPKPVIRLMREATENVLNAAPQFEGQDRAVKGIPSRSALEMMADALDFDLSWSDWQSLPTDAREGVQDYFRPKGRDMRRATCSLWPRGD